MGLLLLCCGVLSATSPQWVNLPPGETRLGDVGVYRIGYTYTDGRSGEMPAGWVGHFHGPTGISYTPHGQQDGKACLLIHCPWRGGTGTTHVDYALRLPQTKPIKLELAVAMKASVAVPDRSDGSDFRVSIQPQGVPRTMLFDQHYAAATWKPLTFDLTPYAGGRVVLRLETGPGPKNDSGWDYALFGDPRIIAGPKRDAVRPAPIWPAAIDLERLIDHRDPWACPTGSKVAEPRLDWDEATGVAHFHVDWPADKGSLTYTVRTSPDGPRAAARLIDVLATVKTADGQTRGQYRLGVGSGLTLTDGAKSWTFGSPEVRVQVNEEHSSVHKNGRSVSTELECRVGSIRARVVREIRLQGSSLVVRVASLGTRISEIRFGGIGAPLRRGVSVPYLGLGPIWYLPDAQVFGSIVLDWTEWANPTATRHDQTAAYFEPQTDGKRVPSTATAYYTLAPRIGEALCNLPNPPSPFLHDLAGRIVFDVWGGRYRDDADWFTELATYGVRDAAIIKHVWQRSGYDNALPNHYPANEALGGDADMVHYVKTTRKLGHRTSLHENYVDFYPNSDLYDANDVALQRDGKPVKAWYNAGVRIQSYGLKPTAILKYARMQSPEIHRRYGTNASYLDVHTCVPPWFHVDHRASEPAAATFAIVRNVHKALFEFERTTHGGPLFGEGNNHFFWAGLCDGCEAQISGGENADWLVDFDLLKIHPRMVNHGMGYLERWLVSGYDSGWCTRIPPTRTMDKYRAMTLAFGHAGFVANQIWHQLPYVLREFYLVTPIQRRYVTARPTRILYETDGRMLPASHALTAGPLSNRVHVEYDNGLRLWCNGSEREWPLEQATLCDYGFRAEAEGLLVTTTTWPTLDGRKLVGDYRRSDGILYADARSFEPDTGVAVTDVEPKLHAIEPLGSRRFKVTYHWQVGKRPSGRWLCYVHFSSPRAPGKEHIAFQQDHELPRPNTWQPGQTVTDGPYEVTVPDNVPDGSYRIMIGLYNEGGRAVLPYKADARGRCEIGTLTLHGGRVTGTPRHLDPRVPRAKRGPYHGHTNPEKAVLDFGEVATNGCIAAYRRNGGWWITVWPRDRAFRIQLRMDRLAPEASGDAWKVTALDKAERELGAVTVQRQANRIEWQTGRPEAAYYRVGQ